MWIKCTIKLFRARIGVFVWQEGWLGLWALRNFVGLFLENLEYMVKVNFRENG